MNRGIDGWKDSFHPSFHPSIACFERGGMGRKGMKGMDDGSEGAF
jgi:hypothetical protein